MNAAKGYASDAAAMAKSALAMPDVQAIGKQVGSQTVGSIVAGVSFASAIAWMDVVRSVMTKLPGMKANGKMHFVVTALMTTLLSVIVITVAGRVTKRDLKASPPVYAVTG